MQHLDQSGRGADTDDQNACGEGIERAGMTDLGWNETQTRSTTAREVMPEGLLTTTLRTSGGAVPVRSLIGCKCFHDCSLCTSTNERTHPSGAHDMV